MDTGRLKKLQRLKKLSNEGLVGALIRAANAVTLAEMRGWGIVGNYAITSRLEKEKEMVIAELLRRLSEKTEKAAVPESRP